MTGSPGAGSQRSRMVRAGSPLAWARRSTKMRASGSARVSAGWSLRALQPLTGGMIAETALTRVSVAATHLVRGTDRIRLMPERVARLHPAGQGVTVAGLPFELGDLLECLWWHPAHERDPARTRLRHMASQAGRIVERS
ncbi:hypothetical protein [Streptomyces fumanus]|uniref:hypothetical protein n=1 Tax=Streptomyces fumanus TaxID=67302 RepID=UPI0033E11D4A